MDPRTEIIALLCEYLALELRFTLTEYELHEAPEAVAALRKGVAQLEADGVEVPHVASTVVNEFLKHRN